MSNNVLTEIKIFFGTIADWLLLLLICTALFFTCNFETVTVWGVAITLPLPSDTSIAAEVFTTMVREVVPASVPLLVTGPMTAFVAQIKVSLLLAMFFTSPFFLYSLMRYLGPALYKRERWLIYMTSGPMLALFAGGAFFAYYKIVPETFRILYTFAEPIGVITYLGVGEFVGLTLALMLVTGVSFTLPVVMVFLSAVKVVAANFWWSHFGKAVVLVLILSAIITPDGSGVSMALMTLPVSGLYGIGALISSRIEGSIHKSSR